MMCSRNERFQKGRGNRQTVGGRVEVLENEWVVSVILDLTSLRDKEEGAIG